MMAPPHHKPSFFRPQRQDIASEYVQKHSEIGIRRDLSTPQGHQRGYVSMMLDQLPPARVEGLGVRDTELFIVGSLVPNKG